MKSKTKVKSSPRQHTLRMPDGQLRTLPTQLAYATWLAIPGTQWTFRQTQPIPVAEFSR